MTKIVVVPDPDNERGVRLIANDTGKVLATGALVVSAIVPDASSGRFSSSVMFEGEAEGKFPADEKPSDTVPGESFPAEPGEVPSVGDVEAAGGTIGDGEPQE